MNQGMNVSQDYSNDWTEGMGRRQTEDEMVVSVEGVCG